MSKTGNADAPQEVVLRGVAASPGVAHGSAFVLFQKELEIPLYEISQTQIDREVQRFERARDVARGQLAELRNEVSGRLGEDEARIFDAHMMVLEDKALIDETVAEIRETHTNVEYCFKQVTDRFIEAFSSMNDEYLKERVTDIDDVARRVLGILLGQSTENLMGLIAQRIIVSENLSPSDAAGFEKGKVLGVVTDSGSRTSHAVIMARSLNVPAVVGLHDASARIHSEDYLLIDGYEGVVVINPSEDTLYRYGQLRDERQSIQRIFEDGAKELAVTADGRPVALGANIGGPEDCEIALRCGAEGVGLYRTEALFIERDAFPDEQTQYEAYAAAVKCFQPHPVIIRTLDLGGDKQVSAVAPYIGREDNPFLGFRAIRFCLEHQDIFKEQLRAILRASAHGKVKIMYPMICSVSEVVAANALLAEAKEELRARGEAFDGKIEVGAMIEIPAAITIADLLARHCQFFSVGTNDLIQYLLAVDRINDRIAHLYDPAHPAVVRALAQIMKVANTHHVHIGVCGEMAADPLFVPLLLGLGADEISASAGALPEIKYLIRSMKLADARKLAQRVVRESEPQRIRQMLSEFYEQSMQQVHKDKAAPKSVAAPN